MATRTVPKKVQAIGLVVVIILLAGLVYVWARPVPQINDAACARIQKGMTEKEVEAIIGTRAGVYTSAFPFLGYDTMDDFLFVEGTAAKKHWEDRAGYINVYFDNRGQVIEARFTPKPST